MRFERNRVSCCFCVLLLLTAFGCSEKADEGESPSALGTEPSTEANVETNAESANTSEPVSAVPAEPQGASLNDVAATVDVEKPISEVQAEAKTMSVESLKATALKYKDAILSKEDQIKAVSAKIKEIPMVEALGQEAQSLKTELQDLGSNFSLLKDRFQVYYDTLKEKGGDLAGLGA